jgi:hypothetical protein
VWGVEYALKGGFLLAHTTSMYHLPKEHIVAHELSWLKKTSGSKVWHSLYNYPVLGVTFYQSNLGNAAILGSAMGVYSFMKLERSFINSKHRFIRKIGLGGVYVSKIHALIDNPKNNAISTYFNYLINLSLGYQYASSKWFFGGGIDWIHMSNAAFKSPNLGLNIPQVKLSFGFLLTDNKLNISSKHSDSTKSRIVHYQKNILLTGFLSKKEISVYPGYSFPVYGGGIYYSSAINAKTNVEGGLDIMYNASDLALRNEKGIKDSSLLKLGAYTGFVKPFDRLHLVLGMGGYIYDPYLLNGRFYQRIGLRYFFSKPIFIHFSLKTHWFNADYAELGFGLRL